MSINLHTALKSLYGDKKARQDLTNSGYKYDSMLSSNQQVWYHPDERKLLVNVAGTHNLRDGGTDMYLAMGKLKDTSRYKTRENIRQCQTVGVDSATVTGHSLGGAIAQYMSSKNDKEYTLDKGATIGQKTRTNESVYRSSGDLVSGMNANSKRMTTLQQNGLGPLNDVPINQNITYG
jgi:hypothetical protein